MFKTYFDSDQLTFLITGGLFFLLSLFLFVKSKFSLSILALSIACLFINFFTISLDDFFNLWDERFHALVAKNMVQFPFEPRLYADPVMNIRYEGWTKDIVWLHKQPLFLWQSALSFKLFGFSSFTFRLPNAILGACLILPVYRSGKLLVGELTGYVTAVLFLSGFYFLLVLSGRMGCDQNDFSFLCYVTLSFWAFIEYSFDPKKKWLLLIGVFSGLAILVKWLVGTLVYSGWIVLKLRTAGVKLRQYKDIVSSLLITVLVALPWQLYTLFVFPVETKIVLEFNNKHLWEPIEDHSGDVWYHFIQFPVIFGWLIPWLIVPSFVVLYYRIKNKNLYYSLLTLILLPFLFFTLVATKMPSFTIICALPVFLAAGALFQFVLEGINSLIPLKYIQHSILMIAVLTIAFFRLDIDAVQAQFTFWKNNEYSTLLNENKKVFQEMKLPENAVVVNVPGIHFIEGMFYTGLPMYNELPDEIQFKDLRKKGRVVAVFNKENTQLPDYLLSDSTTIILKENLKTAW